METFQLLAEKYECGTHNNSAEVNTIILARGEGKGEEEAGAKRGRSQR